MSIPLIEAAKMGNIPEIQRLLAGGADINTTDGRGMSALHHALSQGKEAAALELLQSPGINVNIVSYADGKTILMRAVEKSMKRVIQYLSERFATQLNCTATDNNGDSVLFTALDKFHYSFPIIKLLVENCGHELLSMKSAPNPRTGKTRNPINYARDRAQEEIKELQRLESEITKKRERGEEPSAGEMGMYTMQKSNLEKLVEIIGYLQAAAEGGAGAGAGAGAAASPAKPRRGGSRRRRSTRRNCQRSRRHSRK